MYSCNFYQVTFLGMLIEILIVYTRKAIKPQMKTYNISKNIIIENIFIHLKTILISISEEMFPKWERNGERINMIIKVYIYPSETKYIQETEKKRV